MNKTQNYQLSQWEAGDRVQRTDFNADNAKIDAALGELKAGQLRLVTGSYRGTGKAGPQNPNSLTFPFPPVVVGIVTNHRDYSSSGTIFIRGQTASGGIGAALNEALHLNVSWQDNSVSWNNYYSRATEQLNVADTTYFYFALG